MFKRWKKELDIYLADLRRPSDEKPPTHDFRGKKIHERKLHETPKPTAETIAAWGKVEEELKLQPRSTRFRSALWGLVYLGWFVGASAFILHRMRGDDLDVLVDDVKKRQRAKRQMSNIMAQRQ